MRDEHQVQGRPLPSPRSYPGFQMGLRTDLGEELPRTFAWSSGDCSAKGTPTGRQLSHLARWFVGTRSSIVCIVTSHPARPYYAIRFPVAGVRRQNAPCCQISHIGCVIADLPCSLEGGWSRRIPVCTCGRLERSQVLDMKACLLSLLGSPASVTTHVCVDRWPCPVVFFRHSKKNHPQPRQIFGVSTRPRYIHHEDRPDCGVESNKLQRWIPEP